MTPPASPGRPPWTLGPDPASARPPLLRPENDRVIAGVAAGLAAHLGLPVRNVRIAFGALSLALGAGAILYAWLWVTVPSGSPWDASRDAMPASQRQLAPRLRLAAERVPITDIAVAVLLLGAAAMLFSWWAGADLPFQIIIPALVLLGGLVLAWGQLEHGKGGARSSRSATVLRVVAAILLVAAGAILLISQGDSPAEIGKGALAAVAVLAGVALALAPWLLRLVRNLGDERAARARESERADIAAHLHDSVLQTLAMIRQRSGEPEAVARLARSQERELRAYLYSDRPAPGTSLAQQIKDAAAEIEDAHGVPVEIVVVGDVSPCPALEALVAASREAMANAVRHGAPPVSVYAELGPTTAEVFVRDRGDGFDIGDVPEDRLGVRESILGRMRRHGGDAEITSESGEGTEVRLAMPLQPAGDNQEGNGNG